MTHLSEYKAELADILGVKVGDLPGAFWGTRPKVLMIGAQWALMRRYPKASAQRIRDWLERYQTDPAYLKRTLHARSRHDLNGNSAGRILEVDRERAGRRLRLLRQSEEVAHG